tara:strand:- start:1407 stop:1778 length:372 start_codon:yes stop_codon:yes gene_type:complete
LKKAFKIKGDTMTWEDILKKENDAFTSPIGKRLKEYIEKKYGKKDVSRMAEMYLNTKKNKPDLTEEEYYKDYLKQLIDGQTSTIKHIERTSHPSYGYVVGGEDDKLKEELKQNVKEYKEILGE